MKRHTPAYGAYLVFCLACFAIIHCSTVQSAAAPSTLSTDQLKASPQLFNNASFLMRQFHELKIGDRTITGASFEKVVVNTATLNNVTFVDCSFACSAFYGGNYANVTFKNCRFEETQFRGVVFDKVSFLGGSIAMLRSPSGGKPNIREMFEQMAFMYIKNDASLVLDGVKLADAKFFQVDGGSLILKNMKDFAYDPKYGTLVNSKNLRLHIDNCTISGVPTIADINAPAGFYLTNSSLQGGQLKSWARDEPLPNLYAENTHFLQGTSTERLQTLVLKNCTLEGYLTGQNLYVLNPRFVRPAQEKYPPSPRLEGETIYIAGNNTSADVLFIKNSGKLHITDMSLATLSVEGDVKDMNMYNVRMNSLHFDGGLKLHDGYWENVEVREPLKAASPGVYEFKPVTLYNSTLHGGSDVIDARVKQNGKSEIFPMGTRQVEKPQKPQIVTVPALQSLGVLPNT